MAFRDFTFPEVQQSLGLHIRDDRVLRAVQPRPVRGDFADFIRYGTDLAAANNTEKAKSEFIIAPILLELRRMSSNRFLLFSGVEWDYDRERGLYGYCDFLLTHGQSQHILEAPFAVVVEAKNDIIRTGFGQCLAAMFAAGEANRKSGSDMPIHGVVTTGALWRVLRLDGSTVTIDVSDYFVDDLPLLMGTLEAITQRPVATAA
jgi:hypothetical protein